MDLHAISQLAVAPVFLLAGITGLLNVLSVRLGPAIETRLDKKPHSDQVTIPQAESLSFGVKYASLTGLLEYS